MLGVILAGGLGRRMGGGGKALTDLAGRPLAAHVAERLRPQLPHGALYLNANGPAGAFAAIGLPVIADNAPDRPGPLAGILAALRLASAQSAEYVVTAPTDTPFLPRDLVAKLARTAAKGEAHIVLAASAGGLCQVCGFWPVGLCGPLEAALAAGQRKVLDFAQAQGCTRVDFPPEYIGASTIDPFFNVNTPSDLAQAADLLQSLSP